MFSKEQWVDSMFENSRGFQQREETRKIIKCKCQVYNDYIRDKISLTGSSVKLIPAEETNIDFDDKSIDIIKVKYKN